MLAYAPGRVSCFFQSAERSSAPATHTFGFQDVATLDDGNVSPTSVPATKLTKAEKKMPAELVRRAVGG